MDSVKNHLSKALTTLLYLIGRYLRRLSKEIVIFLPAIVIILVIYNVLQSHSIFEVTKNKASVNPRDLKAKLVLSRLLYQKNNLDSAEVEIRKIVSSSKNDLKTKHEAQKLLTKIENEKYIPTEIRAEIKLWQELDRSYPNSRDINLKLAFLNWKIYRAFEAKKHLEIALSRDPNNEALKKLSLRLR